MKWAVLLVIPLFLEAQEPHFDVRSPLVLVPVIVTDAKGHFVDGLEASDFVVLDNGRAQRAIVVDTIDTGVAPLALVIAVQSSGISAAAVDSVRKIGAMIQPLVTGERGSASVVSFAERITWLQDFTNDSGELNLAFRRLRPVTRPGEDKEARMLDAVQAAIERLRGRPNARRVLLLISESRDRGSETVLETATAAAQTVGVAIYAATYSAFKTAFTSKAPVIRPRRPLKPKMPNDETGSVNGMPPGPYNPYPKRPPPERQVDVLGGISELKRLHGTNTTDVLAKATGGRIFPFTKQKGLEQAIQELGAELHTQYILSFAPEAPVPGYHSLEVRVARGAKYQVRARTGFSVPTEKAKKPAVVW